MVPINSSPISASLGHYQQKYTSVQTTEQRREEFTLTTEAGDRVTISLAEDRNFSATRYNARGVGEGTPTRISSVTTDQSDSREISIQIEGDLNAKERKEIEKAIETVRKAYRDVEKGHAEQAAKRLEKLEHYDTLSQVSASLSYSKGTVIEVA